jgi:hypothetical protein
MRMHLSNDVVLLDTSNGVVQWPECPEEILRSASPRPLSGSDSDDDGDENGDASSEGENVALSDGDEDAASSEADGGGSDAGSKVDSDVDLDMASDEEQDWGSSGPAKDFFEMLKNQFRNLNFVPKKDRQITDVWTTTQPDGDPIPPEIPELLQTVYRKHGWPDLQVYVKELCLKVV